VSNTTINPQEVEQEIHKRLCSTRAGKEWFRCSLEETLAAVTAVSNERLAPENGRLTEVLDRMTKGSDLISSQSLVDAAASMPAYVRGNRSGKWCYSKRTGELAEKGGSRRFGPGQCRFDGEGGFPGFAIRDRLVPCVPIDDVELIE
jgi:hypothetical protein